MTTLIVIYTSFSGVTFANTYQLPAPNCREQAQKIRRAVRAGRVWVYCK